MLFFNEKKKLLQVLGTIGDSVMSAEEIAEQLNMSKSTVSASLKKLERRALVVSGKLMPAEIEIYRTTSHGRDRLAAGSIN